MDKHILLRLFSTVLFLVFIAEIIFVLWACNRHLDFTDESFYILSSLYPGDFTTRFSDFGYLNALIMSITGKNLYALRVSGLFILLAGSFGIVYQSLLWLEKNIQAKLDLSYRYVWILTGMTASTGYYFWGMTTPSYNFYALVGILIASTGFMNILNAQKIKIFSVILLAVGTVILYIGKPTSAVFFVFSIGIWISIAHLLKVIQIRTLVISLLWAGATFFFLFFIYIVCVYGSISNYLTHIKKVQELLSQVGYSSTVLKGNIINSVLEEVSKFYFLVPYSLIVIAFLMYQKIQKNNIISFNITDKAYFYSVSFLIVFAGFFSHKGISWKWAWGYMAILYAVLAYIIFYWARIQKNMKNIFVFILLLLLISTSYVFGTNNPFNIALAGIYIVIGIALTGVAFFIQQFTKSILPTLLSAILVCIFSLSTLGQFFMRPYRSEAKLNQHKNKLNILGDIYVDTHHFEYARQIEEIKKLNPDIDKYDYLVDISGKSGANLILNKKYLGQSWIVLDRTDTYYHFANSILKTIPAHQFKKSILLTNENIPVQKILKDIPISFPDGYIYVGKVFAMPEKEHHLVWIPK